MDPALAGLVGGALAAISGSTVLVEVLKRRPPADAGWKSAVEQADRRAVHAEQTAEQANTRAAAAEAHVAVLEDRVADLERRLTERDRQIEHLNRRDTQR